MNFLNFLRGTKTQAYLALIVLIGGGLIIYMGKLPDNDKNRIFDIMLLTATFYFGSSKSGATKDETIANLASSQQQPIVNTADTVNVK